MMIVTEICIVWRLFSKAENGLKYFISNSNTIQLWVGVYGVLHCQRMRVSLCYELTSSAERNEREREKREREKQETARGKAHHVLITAILLPQRLSCYWGKIVSLRMLTNRRLSDLRLTTAQQRSTGQNLPSDLCWINAERSVHDQTGSFVF
jgi:hypothetical protein